MILILTSVLKAGWPPENLYYLKINLKPGYTNKVKAYADLVCANFPVKKVILLALTQKELRMNIVILMLPWLLKK
jgi:hypothetical protein